METCIIKQQGVQAVWCSGQPVSGCCRSCPIKVSLCFLEQDTLLSLLSTGWLQEQIQGWHTQAKIAGFTIIL